MHRRPVRLDPISSVASLEPDSDQRRGRQAEIAKSQRVFSNEAGPSARWPSMNERCHNPLGTLYGSVYGDLNLGHAAMGLAYTATLGESESFTTIELKINFLRGVRKATLTAEATFYYSVVWTVSGAPLCTDGLLIHANDSSLRPFPTGARPAGRDQQPGAG
jgi:hypothetical protein